MMNSPAGKSLDADEYALRHDQDLGFEASIIRARQNCNLRLLAARSAPTVLEVGCGPSLLVARAAAAGIAFDRWTIVEPASTYHAAALAHARLERRLTVIKGYLENEIDGLREVTPRGFDMILLSGVLHETAQPEVLLRAALALMQASSRLHMIVPNGLSFHRLLAVKMNLIPDPTTLSERNKKLGQSVVFTPSSLRQLAERVGLVPLHLDGYLFKPFTSAQLAVIVRMFGQAIVDGLEELGRDFPEHGAEICLTARKA
jgi:hypothetical protein